MRLALGPTPPPRITFEHFLFVQPNFELIAYRQGLTPQLVGWLSRFAWWSQIGAALELKLTRESIVHGLDTGSTADSILDRLTRHTQRPLPPGVIDAVRNWATRRERVTYYVAATLIEFGSARERDQARASWPAGDLAAPTEVADRFLLVADERSVPFDRLRLIASRDYRRPPEVCVTVDDDGVTMALDPTRSDLLVDAELARFADELPALQPVDGQIRGPALGNSSSLWHHCAEVRHAACPRLSFRNGTDDERKRRSPPPSGSCWSPRPRTFHRSVPGG